MTTVPTAKGALEAALGARFRAVRRAAKISQGELAKMLGCSINTIRWMEAGARLLRFDDIVRAAEAMGVTLDQLAPEGADLKTLCGEG
jgi:transcriptional regulator with XRE-family HTH domain